MKYPIRIMLFINDTPKEVTEVTVVEIKDDNNIIVCVEKWTDCEQQKYFDFSLPDKKVLRVCNYPKEDLNKIYKRLCSLSEEIIEYVKEKAN